MNIQFSFKSISEKDKNFLQDYYYEKKQDRLKTLMSEQDFQNSLLEIKVEKFVKKEAFKIELILRSPTEKFISSEDDHTVIEAFDLALDKLIIQLRKHHERKTN